MTGRHDALIGLMAAVVVGALALAGLLALAAWQTLRGLP